MKYIIVDLYYEEEEIVFKGNNKNELINYLMERIGDLELRVIK